MSMITPIISYVIKCDGLNFLLTNGSAYFKFDNHEGVLIIDNINKLELALEAMVEEIKFHKQIIKND